MASPMGIWQEFDDRPEPSVGRVGMIKLMDMKVTGIVSHGVRHVIKRYLKCTGLSHLKVKHAQDFSPFTMRFLVEGNAEKPLKADQLIKLKYLNECVTYVLSGGESRVAPHPYEANAELLRMMLAKVEPHLSRVYHTRA